MFTTDVVFDCFIGCNILTSRMIVQTIAQVMEPQKLLFCLKDDLKNNENQVGFFYAEEFAC